ncbi:peptidoglycan D,D-transpeptidase FtsI family protein [Loigolactobacillus bifermentans]|uniref:peptidoglycan D,D-transpeptidase FtsI family protein n=1 Tax=Loigolactobacillus bifermentans TaxID=1607 RepID=UPI00070CBA8F|nr:penicillin-binding protein 2 [Loigolactobacillus bifermentans]QGG59628.1 penicillin-binding protein 2 [Loigolactobacillus bifermentans]
MKILRSRTKRAQRQSRIPFRLNFLLFIVFILFVALIAQLGYLQILYGSKFEGEVEKTDKTTITSSVPRGMIYDEKGRVLVGNKANNAISYTKSVDTLSSDIYKTANRLSQWVSVDTGSLTRRDKADYYLANAKNLKKVEASLPKSKTHKANGDAIDSDALYKLELAAVKSSALHLTSQQKSAAAMFKIMSGAYQLSTVYVKNSGMSEKEVAEVSEHLTELPGINVTDDWSRSYPNGSSVASIIGDVSSEKTGLPSDKINEYLAQGYSRNDRVGTSYLEQQYESVLRGTKAQTQVTLNADNKIVGSKKTYSGQKGDNLVLTINSAFQKKVDSALQSGFSSAKSAGATQYSSGAYAMALNPKTGAILAMSGLKYNPKTGKTTSDALGIINRDFVMGSVVKGATVLGGMMDGVITPSSNTITDTPIYFSGGLVKKAVYSAGTYSSLDAAQALEVSSNIYMMRLAMKEGNAKYQANSYFNMKKSIFAKERGYFNQFGLGIKTGIDLPGESAGYEGTTSDVVKALDLSYGNYDAYTTLQLGQYISTIANNGLRMKPYLVQSIRKTNADGSLGTVVSETKPTVLNRVGATQSEINVVKQGMYNVTHGSMSWGTAHELKSFTPAIAGKTGTAQTFYYDPDNPNDTDPPETLTSSFVGYAPANNPKVAVVVVFPNISTSADEAHYNTNVAQNIFKAYFQTIGVKTSSSSTSSSSSTTSSSSSSTTTTTN